MRNRVLLAAGTVAVFVPALLLAQQRPAPRPASRPAPAPAARPQPVRPVSPTATHLEQTWELSAGVGGLVIGKAPTGKSAAFAPGGMLRVGYNLNPMWNISVGTFGGYGSSGTPFVGSTSYLAPFAAVTWTPDINQVTSPFIEAGVGAFYRYNESQTDAAGHVAVGLRHMIGENLAFRGEVGLALFQFKVPGATETSGSGLISVGLSYFVGGRKAVANVAVTPRTATLAALGATQQLSASPMDKNGKPLAGRVVTWSSSNSSVATVSASGLVTARSNGTATITAASETGTGSAAVTVAQAAATVAVAPATASLSAIGQTQQLAVTAKDANNNTMTGAPVTWTSSDTHVATVDASGVVTAAGNGTARITAASGSHSGAATVTVAQATASVAVTPPSSVLSAAGATVQLSAQASDANGQAIADKTLTWASDATGVATVSASGVVTAVANGVAHISATADGQSGSALVSVVVAPKGAAAGLPTLPAANASLVIRNVNFRVGSSVLLPAAKTELNRMAIAIQGVSNAKWEIGGYTSSLGRAATNLRLSRLRANAVRAYLISKGVPAASLTAVGYGSAHPIGNNRTVAGRRENMRVEIKRLQ